MIFYFTTPWGRIIEKALKPRMCLSVCHDPIPHKGESIINKIFSESEYKRSQNIIVMSEQYKELVSKRFSLPLANVFYMPHGLYKNYNEIGAKKTDTWYSDENMNFLFFGRLEKYKGIELLVDAYLEGEIYKDATLTIAGDGDISYINDKLAKAQKIRVINRFIQDEEVALLFNHSKVVCVIPYIEATQSGVIATAAEFLTPIISSNVGGLVEQLDNGKVGVIFPSKNKDKLIDAMKMFANDYDFYERQKELLMNYRENHSWEKITRELLIELEHVN